MSARGRYFRSFVAGMLAGILWAGVFWVDTASAQSSAAGCTLERVEGTSRQILRCREGLTIIVEGGARFTLVDRDRNGSADAVRLRRKALLLEAPAGRVEVASLSSPRRRSLRCEAQNGQSTLARQDVCLRRQRSRRCARPASMPVVLGPGEGVDVAAGPGTRPSSAGPPRVFRH
jgi:hypothetical protein